MRQYKQDLMARFMTRESINRKLKQSEIAREIGCLSSTFQQYGQHTNLFSPYRIPPKNNKRKKRVQTVNMSSKDLH